MISEAFCVFCIVKIIQNAPIRRKQAHGGQRAVFFIKSIILDFYDSCLSTIGLGFFDATLKYSDLVCWLVKNRQLFFHLIQSFQSVLVCRGNCNKCTTEGQHENQ